MAIIKKGPSAKKKLTLIVVLFSTLMVTGLVLYFEVFKQDAAVEPVAVGVQSEVQKQESSQAIALSGSIKELLEFFKQSSAWQVLHLASSLSTTTASSLGRGDPFETIPGYETEEPTLNQ